MAARLLLPLLASLESSVARGAVPCSESRQKKCCGDHVCEGPENINNCLEDCPGVTTHPTCGEEPHSDRGGRGLTFGVGYRATSAQDCCDKCRAHAKQHNGDSGKKGPCNSWTFCGYPVCWGLDTGWNHTYGECWLRSFADPTTPTFGQRGALAPSYRKKFLRTRSKCKEDLPGGLSEGWSCPPTHVPWTSGSLGGLPFDPKVKWETSGGWGNMRIHKLDNEGVPMVETCSKNAGQPC